jgi:hypothetical protein
MEALTLLTSAQGAFQAHVLAARLAAEGIESQLRGAGAGPYGLTVGDFGRVDLYVPAERVAEASMVLLADEADAALRVTPPRPRRATWPRWVVVVAVLVAALAPVVRLLTGS